MAIALHCFWHFTGTMFLIMAVVISLNSFIITLGGQLRLNRDQKHRHSLQRVRTVADSLESMHPVARQVDTATAREHRA